MLRVSLAVVCAIGALPLYAQTPQPFPRPAESRPPGPQAPPAQPGRGQAPATVPSPAAPAQPQTAAAAPQPGAPTQAELGFPIYPASQFLGAYDAGRGQKYYLFGTTAPFADLVGYYRTQLDEKGDLVFREPPTHMFEVGRFREETMAFPPGVTVKDWTWGGSQGYLNPKPGAQPARFPTVVMIVPAPAPAAAAAPAR